MAKQPTPEERASKLWDETLWVDGHSEFVEIVAAAIREAQADAVKPWREAMERIAQAPSCDEYHYCIHCIDIAQEALKEPPNDRHSPLRDLPV